MPTICSDEQLHMLKNLPMGRVPSDRRICMLERDLIMSTQSDAHIAWECQQTLQRSTIKVQAQASARRI